MPEQGTMLTDEVIVEPRASSLDPPLFDPVILCPVGPQITLTARLLRGRKNLRPFIPASVYTIKYQKNRASLVGPCLGAPAAVYVLERILAHRVRSVVLLGLCGSLNPEVRIGHLLVPSAAWSEEGVSPHYVADAQESRPGERALAALQETLASCGRSYHLGPVWTTDAIFRETKKKVVEYGRRGILAVEMEASALFTVARYRGIELGALLVVSDELYDLRWRQGFTRPAFLKALHLAGRLALAAALKLAGKNGGPEEMLPPTEERNGALAAEESAGEENPSSLPPDTGHDQSGEK